MKSKIAAISIITKAEASRLEASAEAAAIVADGIVVERDGALWAIGWLDASGPLPSRRFTQDVAAREVLHVGTA